MYLNGKSKKIPYLAIPVTTFGWLQQLDGTEKSWNAAISHNQVLKFLDDMENLLLLKCGVPKLSKSLENLT